MASSRQGKIPKTIDIGKDKDAAVSRFVSTQAGALAQAKKLRLSESVFAIPISKLHPFTGIRPRKPDSVQKIAVSIGGLGLSKVRSYEMA
jgi:hypothetical protein